MEWIEQAVFTSAETARSAGYQVVAAGNGIGRCDLAELAVWGPSHDALLDSSPGAASLNFHPLPSGAYCVSRTTSAGREYSGRGSRIYTQCLVVPPKVLQRFANNPFALMRAAVASGSLRVYDEIPRRLEPLRLAGGTALVDAGLLARLAANPGPDWMAILVQAALESASVAVVGSAAAEQVVAGLINCLPPECRTEFSFSTGLKFSPRRPFRVVAIAGDVEEERRVQRLYNVTVLDFSGDPPDGSASSNSWARFIRRVLKSGRTSLLASLLTNCPWAVTPDELPALGLQFLEELDASDACAEQCEPPRPAGHAAEPTVGQCSARRCRITAQGGEFVPPGGRTQADRAHRPTAESVENPGTSQPRPPGPSTRLEPAGPAMLKSLRKLDALVYEAITGQESSLEQVRATWRRLEGELSPAIAAQWREQYLRYALSIWAQSSEAQGVRCPGRAVRSLDVVCSLLDEPQLPPPV